MGERQTDDEQRPVPMTSNADEGDCGAPILYLEGWCASCAQTVHVHMGLDARPCRCGASLVDILGDGQRWRRAGAARDLGAILGRRPEEARRDGTRIVGWFAGGRRVADSRWSGGGWRMLGADGWERVEGELLAWLPCTLEAESEELA
ncbi:hypothetical protein [Azospirillum canadense]|uniref:hypothetical protein n=1 Tax=Azospirillum canadense TaxID=403962 RepID=UPI0022276D7A|nr:hypothetical protein [Azospirillum canadense]MCW2242826.1 hypothetical protein [Azospirillum canadense]